MGFFLKLLLNYWYNILILIQSYIDTHTQLLTGKTVPYSACRVHFPFISFERLSILRQARGAHSRPHAYKPLSWVCSDHKPSGRMPSNQEDVPTQNLHLFHSPCHCPQAAARARVILPRSVPKTTTHQVSTFGLKDGETKRRCLWNLRMKLKSMS